MSTERPTSSLRHLVAEILHAAAASDTVNGSVDAVERDFRSILRRDYAGQLKRYFTRREMSTVLAALIGQLPALNRDLFRTTELDQLAQIADRLGAGFKAISFQRLGGRALRGFYVDEGRLVRRPLICVNTAHHPVAVAAAFWHELGHHLTARALEKQQGPVNLSFSADYDEHLNDPLELIADTIVALTAYPKPAGRRLFGEFLRKGRAPNVDEIIVKAGDHFRAISGFNFDGPVPTMEKLHYLAGMIHYAGLRWALLSEYDV